MTAKRFMIDDCGTLIDMHTRNTFDYVSDVCDLLNMQHETIQRLNQNVDELLSVNIEEELLKENEQLKQAYAQLKHRHSLLHDVCIDAECDRDSYRKDIASLEKENEQLKIRFKEERERALKFGRDIDTLTVKNEQLQARNDRQAKRLAELYELMAKKDWESLTEIIDDFKRCEEQLQREWGTYE